MKKFVMSIFMVFAFFLTAKADELKFGNSFTYSIEGQGEITFREFLKEFFYEGPFGEESFMESAKISGPCFENNSAESCEALQSIQNPPFCIYNSELECDNSTNEPETHKVLCEQVNAEYVQGLDNKNKKTLGFCKFSDGSMVSSDDFYTFVEMQTNEF